MARTLLLLFLFLFQIVSARMSFGVFAGGASYLGELNDDPYRRTKPAVGVSLNYDLTNRLLLQTGLTIGSLEGAGKYGQNQFVKQTRNLSFQSSLTEFTLLTASNQACQEHVPTNTDVLIKSSNHQLPLSRPTFAATYGLQKSAAVH